MHKQDWTYGMTMNGRRAMLIALTLLFLGLVGYWYAFEYIKQEVLLAVVPAMVLVLLWTFLSGRAAHKKVLRHRRARAANRMDLPIQTRHEDELGHDGRRYDLPNYMAGINMADTSSPISAL